MDIFDGLHPQCADSIDVEKSDSSEDSDMEVIEQLVDPAEADLARLIVDVAESELPTPEVEQHVQQMVAARAQAVPEPDPVCNLPAAKRQATITSYFRK